MRKRRLRRFLAVSTIVGNMLMILITLSLAAILVAWAGTSFGAFSGGSSLFFAERGQAMQERFVIEEVFFNATPPTGPQQIFVFVRNVGPININVVAIYVNGTSASTSSAGCSGSALSLCIGTSHGWDSFSGTTNFDVGCSPLGTSAGLAVGAVCEFALDWPTGGSSCSPSPYWCTTATTIFQIVVASARGNQVATTVRAT